MDDAFGHWLAGFTDGEGCFYIASLNASRPGVYRPRFALTLRCDDRPVVEAARRALDGAGTIHEYEPSGPGRRVVRWMFQSQADCETLCGIFGTYQLRSKKLHDFLIWREAVAAAAHIQRGSGSQVVSANADAYAKIKNCKHAIEAVRAYE